MQHIRTNIEPSQAGHESRECLKPAPVLVAFSARDLRLVFPTDDVNKHGPIFSRNRSTFRQVRRDSACCGASRKRNRVRGRSPSTRSAAAMCRREVRTSGTGWLLRIESVHKGKREL